MSLITGVSDFFGLDLGTTGVRLVQLHGNGASHQLVKYAHAPVDSNIAMSDSNADQQKLVQVIKELIDQTHVSTRNVAVGIPSQRVFTTVVDIDRLSPGELAKTIRFQADSLIPTPLAESKIDWAIIGESPKEKTKVEVLLTSVSNNFVEKRLDMLESIGLNVIALEPDNLALARALVAPGTTAPQIVVDVGFKTTDMVVIFNDAPRLTRSIPTGTDAIVRAAMQNLNIEQKQAEQFVFKFGLGKDKLEGQVYQAIVNTVELIVGEIEKSIKFFQTRYPSTKLERVIVTGGASTLPEFPSYIANKFNLSVEIGNAWRNTTFPPDRQNELMAISNSFSVAAGLAERQE